MFTDAQDDKYSNFVVLDSKLLVPPIESVMARTPAAPQSIKVRRPNLSTVKTATHETMKYSVPLHAVISLANLWLNLALSCRTLGM